MTAEMEGVCFHMNLNGWIINSMKTETITIDEWRKKGTELFGKDSTKWLFVCPVCRTPQTAQDFIDSGLSEDEARSSIAIECIGRHLPKAQSQKAISDAKVIKGKPCDYAGYGFFKLNPVAVEDDDGHVFNIFDFA